MYREKIYRLKRDLQKKIDYITPDKIYLKKLYKIRTGRELNLKNPVGYTEKLNWLKLHDRKKIYTMMADKYAVRNYVADKIGEKYLIPLIGCWKNVEEIEFNLLPERFVLKCNHDNGVIICNDKKNLNIEGTKAELRRHLDRNFYKNGREWPYKNIKRKIVCEQFLECKDEYGLVDYKFYCFNGQVKALKIVSRRYTDIRIDYLDINFNCLPIMAGYPNSNNSYEKPEKFEEMIDIAEKLSEGIPHVRIDLYCVNNEVFFGEMTFYDSAGFIPLEPEAWERKFGEWIELPDRGRKLRNTEVI